MVGTNACHIFEQAPNRHLFVQIAGNVFKFAVGFMGPLTMVRSWTGRPWQASVRSPKRLEKTSAADAGFRGYHFGRNQKNVCKN